LARIQEEFVAILGHDLRNPVAAFAAGVRQLSREAQTDKSAAIISLLNTSLRRMNELIDNMMMHAKSRLGGGIRITSAPDAPVHDSITHIVEEIRMAAPDSRIELKWSGKFGQRAKVYPTLMNGYGNDEETELFRQV